MSYIPRSHYLTLHDTLRRLLGPNAQLAAFVKAKKNFQCDMLVNCAQTDPETLYREGVAASSSADSERNTSSSSSSSADHDTGAASSINYSKKGVSLVARQLQELLGFCDVVPHTRRIDVAFRDRTVIQLALGAGKADLPFAVEKGEDINQEPDWRKRNRLRVSLGFDEELFLAACTRTINVAARTLEKSMYDYFRYSAMLQLFPAMAAAYEASGQDWRAVLPPIIYWKAHGYALEKAYGCRHYQNAAATVEHNFAEYYGVFPMDNPFCPGEDLNTIEVVRWLCEARKTGGLLTLGTEASLPEAATREAALSTPSFEAAPAEPTPQ
ncbi:hypothetical protein ABB37_01909 [Leptomonas pyrrhocoris]|uniref:Uncharacterized protein n=1 Tax=Leptomonas pyrrhocoris TaxID=157538 RepID=A0A0N1J560_LEPPY|nr:hypothetical protein ABB37_01909 [Leptomonas pyrrhocoris]KPA83641.1 hypothetical protein ABB37_01909 [Leptomonas pyrrhocoris]|eukprot:XP_015662080.1 hypothetical protein ABB37_01909 [Leptomonas pyrrhocoris]